MPAQEGCQYPELLSMPSNNRSLWNFATGLYSQNNVSQLCLELQDDYDQDVCLLLFLCWYGLRFGPMDAKLLSRCQSASQQWQDSVVIPLRHCRRWLKQYLQAESGRLDAGFSQASEEFRESIKERELAAERLQFERLLGLLSETAANDASKHGNNAESSSDPGTAIKNCLLALPAAVGDPPAAGLQEKLTELAAAASRFAQSERES
jgi:uncharacterized protein (TIGR02444 family)